MHEQPDRKYALPKKDTGGNTTMRDARSRSRPRQGAQHHSRGVYKTGTPARLRVREPVTRKSRSGPSAPPLARGDGHSGYDFSPRSTLRPQPQPQPEPLPSPSPQPQPQPQSLLTLDNKSVGCNCPPSARKTAIAAAAAGGGAPMTVGRRYESLLYPRGVRRSSSTH